MYIINIRVPEVIQTARLYQLLAVVLLVEVVSKNKKKDNKHDLII